MDIACTLSGAEFGDRGAQWRALIDGRLIASARTARGVSLTLRDDAGVFDAAERLIQLEAECCAWMHMTLTRRNGVVLDITGDGKPAGDAIASIFSID